MTKAKSHSAYDPRARHLAPRCARKNDDYEIFMCSCKYVAGKVQPFMSVLTRFLVYPGKGPVQTEAAGVLQERFNRKGDRDDGGFKLNTLRPTRGNDSGTTGP